MHLGRGARSYPLDAEHLTQLSLAMPKRERMDTQTVEALDEARIDLDFGTLADRPAWLDRGRALITQAGQLRCHGSAVAAIAQVASGDLDAFVHMSLNPWDYAAGMLVVAEAGGSGGRLGSSDAARRKLFSHSLCRPSL